MNRHALIWITAGAMLLAGNGWAKEINLAPGESYSQGDLTVTCGQASAAGPLTLTNCQIWDDFDQKCLFEKTTYVYKKIECVEECQHWDEFNNTCLYRTTCAFSPAHEVFVRTSCEKFDDSTNSCVQTRENRIGR